MYKLIWQNNLGEFSLFNATNLIGNAFFIKGFQKHIQILSVFANGLETEAERFLSGVDFNHDVAERQCEYSLNKGGQSALFHFADIADEIGGGCSMDGRAMFKGIIGLAV